MMRNSAFFFPLKSSFSRAFLRQLTLLTAIFGNTTLHRPDQVCVHLLVSCFLLDLSFYFWLESQILLSKFKRNVSPPAGDGGPGLKGQKPPRGSHPGRSRCSREPQACQARVPPLINLLTGFLQLRSRASLVPSLQHLVKPALLYCRVRCSCQIEGTRFWTLLHVRCEELGSEYCPSFHFPGPYFRFART